MSDSNSNSNRNGSKDDNKSDDMQQRPDPHAMIKANSPLHYNVSYQPDDITYTYVKVHYVDDDASYASDIDQVIFKSPMDEVVFFHKCSKTVIFCDLIQRFPESRGWKGWLMTADGLVGERGSTPKEWRFLVWWTGKLDAARLSLEKVLYEWQPERLIIARGHCVSSNATQIIDHCLTWIPRDCAPSRERCCGCGRQSG